MIGDMWMGLLVFVICGHAAFLQNAGVGRWCTQSVALGWYTVSRWDTGCGAVLKRNRVCLFGDASLVDDGTPPFEALVGVAEFFRLCSLVLDDEFDEGILRMVYFGEED